MCFDTGHRLEAAAEQWRGGAAVIPEQTKRMNTPAARSSATDDAFGSPLRARHGEPVDSRLQTLG